METTATATDLVTLAGTPAQVGAAYGRTTGACIRRYVGDFLVIERTWSPSDRVTLRLPLPIRVHSGGPTLAISRGPLVYGYFQDAQADPMIFEERRGLYPEDLAMFLPTDQVEQALVEEPAADHLLGPALRVRAVIQGRDPIFAQPTANSALPQAEEQTVVLLPFANQGAVRGEYRVFMRRANA